MDHLPKSKSPNNLLKFLITCAVQAPSSHNTQPWKFAIQNKSILVMADLTRRLPVGDSRDRELYVSVGTCLQNLMFGAQALGLKAKLEFFPKSPLKDLVARVTIDFKNHPSKSPDQKLLSALWSRRSNRTMYDPTHPVKQQTLDLFAKIAAKNDLTLNLISKKDQIDKIGEMVRLGMVEFMNKDAFRAELSGWVRHNWSKKGDGLPGYSIGMPGVVSILAPLLVRSKAPINSIALEEKKAVQSCPTVGVITLSVDDKLSWVKTGMTFESIAIQAELVGLATSILTAAVECPSQHVKLKKLVKGTPSLFFRIGYTTGKGIAVPRRDGQQVMVDLKA